MKAEQDALDLSSGDKATVPPEQTARRAISAPAPKSVQEAYHRGSALARNTLLNLAGQGAPLVAALFAIPLLDAGLGTDRYGLLLIVWMFLGYFSLFDLGLSRALTQLLAEKLGMSRAEEVPPLVWTALSLTFAMGLVGSIVLALLAPWIVYEVLTGIPEAARQDCLHALYALAVSIPVVVSTASLRGILEARQRFDLVNAIRIPMGIFTFAGPLLVLPFFPTLFAVVLTLVAGRLVAWGVHLSFCLRIAPELRRTFTFERTLAAPLLRFGGWMTVSNVISPLMVYMDRFIIGAVLSATAVAYYATPWEVVTKLLIVPAAFVGVVFPSFSFWQHRDAGQMRRLYYAGLKLVLVALFPLTLLTVVLAEPALLLWMGADYAAHGFRPMQLLAIGVLVNGAASVPFALLQGVGRPDLTAKAHALELPLYALALWGLILFYGLAGVALAWLLRVVLDFLLLFFLSKPFVAGSGAEHRKVFFSVLASVAALGLALLPLPPSVQIPVFLFLLLMYGAFAWKALFLPEERAFLRRLVGYTPLDPSVPT